MDKTDLKYIGKPVNRADGLNKVTGREIYVHDLEFPGMLHAKVLHSPYARAKIKSIDTSKAKALPGVKAVLTGEDSNHKYGVYLVDKTIIARNEARYQGEVVAAVAAETEEIAEEAVSLIKVDYEVLPAVLTIDDALKCDYLVHDDINELEGQGVFFPQKDTNIASWNKNVHGDLDKAFAEADLIEENVFYLPACGHVPLETHVSIAKADPYSDRIEVWSSAQSPFTVKSLLAGCFSIEAKNIQVHITSLGGGFGGKAGLHHEPLVALLSKASEGRPVKLRSTREEEFNQLPTRAAMRTTIKSAVKKDGTITGVKVYYDWDSGAYADYAANVGKTAVYSGLGPYQVENVEIHSRTIYTNKVFSTAYRGFGHLETHWANERQIDMIAQKLHMDPVEIRMKNLLRPGSRTITGQKITERMGSPIDCLQAVVKEIGWKGYQSEKEREAAIKTGKAHGIGLAVFHKAPAMPANTTTGVIIQPDINGNFKVQIGAVDMGQGIHTIMAQIAAETLDVPVERVEVVHGIDTDRTPFDWQTVASKATFMVGNAVIKACHDIIHQMKMIAVTVFHCDYDSLRYGDGYIYHAEKDEQRLSYKELIRGYAFPDGSGFGGVIIGRGAYMAEGLTNLNKDTGEGNPALHWTFGAHAVDMEIDVATGEIHVKKIATAIDCGKAINEKMVISQIKGGVIQGLGSAVCEGYIFNDKGVLLNHSFTDYKIPTALDIPDEIVPIIIENPEPHGPYGARGMAEHPMIAVPSAVGNAVYDALGYNPTVLPLSPENVVLGYLNHLKEKE